MPVSTIKRVTRRLAKRTINWGTIIALSLGGNKIEKKVNLRRSMKPVLLLYGFGATRRTLSILERRLFNDGYAVFSLNLGGFLNTFNTDAIESIAEKIDEKIEHLYKKYKIRGKLSIIGHSKGGLIGHYYIKRLGGDRRVKLLITMGAPHSGNPWALLSHLTPISLVLKSFKQMSPLSSFIRRLKIGPFPKKVKFFSIYSKDDRMCIYPAAVVEEAPNVKNVEVDSVSHSEFLIKKSVYHLIRHALEDQMPKSLEERTRQKVKEYRSPLRFIEGAKNKTNH